MTIGKLFCSGTWIPAHSMWVKAPRKKLCLFCNEYYQAVRGGDDEDYEYQAFPRRSVGMRLF